MFRVESGGSLASNPLPRTRHLVTNVMIDRDEAGRGARRSPTRRSVAFCEARGQQILTGSYEYVLRKAGRRLAHRAEEDPAARIRDRRLFRFLHDLSGRAIVIRAADIDLIALRSCSPGGPRRRRRRAIPSQPIRIVVSASPGGPADTVARLASQMLVKLGQPAVVENRAGAGGALAAREVAAAKPDGHTLMVGNTSTMAVIPAMSAKPRLRFAEGLRAGRAVLGELSAPGGARRRRPGRRRRTLIDAAQGQSRQAHLRAHRAGRHAEPVERTVPGAHRHQARAGAVPQRRRACDRGADAGGGHLDRRLRRDDAAGARRPAAGAGGDERGAHAARAGDPDHDGGGRARLRRDHVLRHRRAGRHARDDRAHAQHDAQRRPQDPPRRRR